MSKLGKVFGLAIALLSCLPAIAGISVPPSTPLGKPILAAAEVDVPEGAMVAYQWQASPGVSLVSINDGQQVYVWAVPGNHSLDLVVAWATDEITLQTHRAEFACGEPPKPTPVDSLRDLVSGKDADTLGLFYADWSEAVADGKVDSTKTFRAAHESTRDGLGLTDVAEAYAIVDNRLAAIIGSDDKPIDTPLRDALASELESISTEFGAPAPPDPDVPDVEAGPREVLIVRETAVPSPELAGLIVDLRKPQSANYLAANKHRLIIQDDDPDSDGNRAEIVDRYENEWQSVGLPAIVIIDPKTEAVLYKGQLQGIETGDNIIELIRQHGG